MSQGGPNNVSGSGGPPIETLTGNSGGAVGPDAVFNVDLLGNTSTGIDIVGTPASNLVTVIGLSASVTQVGTVELATAIETGTLIDTTRAISPDSLAPILITPFVVAPGGAYTTIQSAINAANSVGGGTVYIRLGNYSEDLTLYDQVNLVAVPAISQGLNAGVYIDGTHIPPSSGHVLLNGITFVSTTNVFDSAAAGTAHITVSNCESAVQNGFLFNLPNWTGAIEIYDCNPNTRGAPWAINDGGINNTGGAAIIVYNSGVGSGTNQMVISGSSFFGQAVNVGCPVLCSTGTSLISVGSQYNGTVTIDNNSTINSTNDSYITGAAQAILMSSSADSVVANAVVDSTNNPSIGGAGAGTLTLTNVSFLNNSALAGTLTLGSSSVYPVDLANGELLIGSSGQPAVASTITAGSNITVTNAAGSITIAANGGGELAITSLDNTDTPYTVLSTDEYLSCDVSLGVLTIELPNAPITGRVVIVKDSGGDAGTNNITVTTVGGIINIDGATTFVMNTNYEAANFIFNGSTYEVF